MLNIREPRMRGDDPAKARALGMSYGVSPACAGMIPSCVTLAVPLVGEPRMRGDDPDQQFIDYMSD